MNIRSIHFRLIAWYAGVLLLVLLGFGAFIYTTLRFYSDQVLRETFMRRVEQISELLASDAQAHDETYTGREVQTRYDPAANERFVRITRGDGRVIYLSRAPNDHLFVPEEMPAWNGSQAATDTYQLKDVGGAGFLVATKRVHIRDERYLIEVGGSLAGGARLLHRLLLTLLLGLPAVLAIVILGGYILTKRALRPVKTMMFAAQEITMKELSRRLPLVDTGDEIAHLTKVLNQMIARLDESFQNTIRFTADASHELRTPLTIIRGEIEAIMLRRDLDPELKGALASLLEEVERLVNIVEGLFALSRLDSGEAQKESARFDLAKLAKATAEQMCLLAEEKHIDLVYETAEAVEVEGDRARLKQVVVNLLDNAIKYTPENGRISLTVRAGNSSALLEVADTGPGVPEAALPHLFERFYRADDVRSRDIGGAGLGLSIVHSICTAHGGFVTATNTPPKGCRFAVELPLAPKL